MRLPWRRPASDDIDEELRAHLRMAVAERVARGEDPREAERAARREFGIVTSVAELTREMRRGAWLDRLLRELRYALRTLRRSPVFLVVATVILAIGIGSATALFTIVNAALLRPLSGVSRPAELVTIERVQPERTSPVFSYPDYYDFRQQTTALAGLAAFAGTPMSLSHSGGSTQPWVGFGSDNFFQVLGVKPALGRLFGSQETGQVVVLSYALWQQRFGGSPNVIGSKIALEGHPYSVVGVAPRGFIGAIAGLPMELWIPITVDGRVAPALSRFDISSRRGGALRLVGRRAPNKSVDDAQRDLANIAARLAATYITNRGRGVHVFSGAGKSASELEERRRIPRLLTMAVGLLLLIACGSVAGLSLVRAFARRRELATRVALGASRASLVRLVVLEGVVVAGGALLLGVLVAKALVRSTTLVRTVVDMSELDLALDMRVLGVAIAASAVTAALVSLLPASHIFRVSPATVLKDGAGALRRSLAQRILVAAQVCVSLALLSAAAIVFSTFQRILAAHRDVTPGALTYAPIDPSPLQTDEARQLVFYHELLRRAEAEPGIERAALASTIPPLARSNRASIFRRGEEPAPNVLAGREGELGLGVNAIAVSDHFFEAMRIPFLRGDGISAHDDARAESVAIVSRRLAEMLWPGQDPVGRLLSWPEDGRPGRPIRVLGVVADTRDVALAAAPPLTMYLPFEQRLGWNLSLVLRGRGYSTVDAATLRRIVADVNPSVSVSDVETLDERLRHEMRPQRMAGAWIGVFGAIALILAAIGVYGVVAQGVIQRTRELALRNALGASSRRLLANVMGEGLRFILLGAIVGALASVAAFAVLRSIFAGVQPVDLQLGSVAAALLAVALLAAAYLPARRAIKLNPADVLRSD